MSCELDQPKTCHLIDRAPALRLEPRDNHGRPVAAVLRFLSPVDEAELEGGAVAAPGVLDEARLCARIEELQRLLSQSRASCQSVADAERRRIEQDLHDGAQQRLVSVLIRLTLVAEMLDDTAAELIRDAQIDLEEAIGEIRSLGRGLYPRALAQQGLVCALDLVASYSPVPIAIHAAGVGRYSREIEAAVYFCCLEAIQNATKHARDAETIWVDLRHTSVLVVAINDNGTGFDATSAQNGRGLTNMRDRVEAVGGQMTIESKPGQGTRILVRIPLPAAAQRAA